MIDSDEAILRRAFQGLAGQAITEWRRGYADSGSFHIGRSIPEQGAFAKGERGSWVLTVWAASVSLAPSASDVRVLHHPPLALRELQLERFAGGRIEHASMEADGTVLLRLESSARIEIVPDPEAAGDADQWTLETEALGTFLVRSGPTILRE